MSRRFASPEPISEILSRAERNLEKIGVSRTPKANNASAFINPLSSHLGVGLDTSDPSDELVSIVMKQQDTIASLRSSIQDFHTTVPSTVEVLKREIGSIDSRTGSALERLQMDVKELQSRFNSSGTDDKLDAITARVTRFVGDTTQTITGLLSDFRGLSARLQGYVTVTELDRQLAVLRDELNASVNLMNSRTAGPLVSLERRISEIERSLDESAPGRRRISEDDESKRTEQVDLRIKMIEDKLNSLGKGNPEVSMLTDEMAKNQVEVQKLRISLSEGLSKMKLIQDALKDNRLLQLPEKSVQKSN